MIVVGGYYWNNKAMCLLTHEVFQTSYTTSQHLILSAFVFFSLSSGAYLYEMLTRFSNYLPETH